MTYEILNDLSSIENIRAEWNRWCSSIPGKNIYLTHNWALANLRLSGHRPAVILGRDSQGTIVSLIPLEIRNFFGLRILQPVGNDFIRKIPFPSDLLNADAVFDLIGRQIPHHILIWNYFYISEKESIRTKKTGWFRFAPELIIDLTPSPEEIFQSLDRKMRRNLFRRIRNIERDLGEPRLEKPVDLQALTDLFELNKDVFSHKKYDSLFNHDQFRNYFTALLDGLEKDYFRIYRLKTNNDVLAMRLAYVTGDRLQLRIPGYNYNYRRYSLSHSLLKFIIEDARAEGFKSISFMRGNESFKYDWNPTEVNRYRLFRYKNIFFYLYYQAMLSLSREIPRFWERVKELFSHSS